MKNYLKKKLFVMMIALLALGLFHCAQADLENKNLEENNKADEEIIKPLETVQLEDGGEVKFFEDDGDFIMSIKSRSSITINELKVLSPMEIYEKYKGTEAPEKLINAVQKSGYKPQPLEESEVLKSGPSRALSIITVLEEFYLFFGSDALIYHIKNNSAAPNDTYKREIRRPTYMVVGAAPVSGTMVHKMRRRVIRAFKSNYWTTISSPDKLYPGERLYIRATSSKSREITSDVYNNTGRFHHVAGRQSY